MELVVVLHRMSYEKPDTIEIKYHLQLKDKLEGDVLMITSGNNASKNECPTVGTDESL